MKRVFPYLVALCLVLVLAVPVLASDLTGGYYITGDSSMGTGLKFYVPSNFVSGSLTYDDAGYLFNLTNSSIYLYCPDYPDYTIYAPRFSVFQYRESSGTGYIYQDLNLTNVSDTNVEILTASPVPILDSDQVLVLILAVLIVFVGAFVILRR